MRVLFTTIPGSGHFNPMVPLAHAFADRGHEVTFAASASWTPRINAAGFENIPSGPTWVESLQDPVMQDIVRKDLFIDLTRMGMVEDVVRAAKSVGAELIVRGAAEHGGQFAGAILGLPVVAASPAAGKMWREMTRETLARAAGEHGLDAALLSSDGFEVMYIDRTPASLETPGFTPYANLVNVRPEEWDGGGEVPAWVDALPERPLVYVTFGTVFSGNLPLFRLAADALAEEPVNVVLATGSEASAAALGTLPANARAAGYVPQSKIVARAAAVICHAGYNSVISAMSAGVPVYAMPMGADQPYNATRLVEAGAALSSPIYDGPPVAGPPPFTPPSPAELRDAVRRLIAEPRFRENARRIAAEIHAMLPVATAVERLEAMLAVDAVRV